jgi:hypothetical protein
MLGGLWQDIRYGARMLLKTPTSAIAFFSISARDGWIFCLLPAGARRDEPESGRSASVRMMT